MKRDRDIGRRPCLPARSVLEVRTLFFQTGEILLSLSLSSFRSCRQFLYFDWGAEPLRFNRRPSQGLPGRALCPMSRQPMMPRAPPGRAPRAVPSESAGLSALPPLPAHSMLDDLPSTGVGAGGNEWDEQLQQESRAYDERFGAADPPPRAAQLPGRPEITSASAAAAAAAARGPGSGVGSGAGAGASSSELTLEAIVQDPDLVQEKLKSGIVPVIRNIVATVNLGAKLDLKKIAMGVSLSPPFLPSFLPPLLHPPGCPTLPECSPARLNLSLTHTSPPAPLHRPATPSITRSGSAR